MHSRDIKAVEAVAGTPEYARVLLAAATLPMDTLTGELVARLGASETVLLATRGGRPAGFDPGRLAVWREATGRHLSVARFEDIVVATAAAGMRVLFPTDPAWPPALNDLGAAAPLMLWARGDTGLLAGEPARVGVVGAKTTTDCGIEAARNLAAGLAGQGHAVVAGGGFGIDAAAHTAAMEHAGGTIAVLPSGLHPAFPAGNDQLHADIGRTGLLVSQLPPGMRVSRTTFLARNRLLAALADATVLVEDARGSSGMQIALAAARLGRPVGAIPVQDSDPSGHGARHLLSTGTARPVTRPEHVTTLLQHSTGGPGPGRDDTPARRTANRPSPTGPPRPLSPASGPQLSL